jgi:predicted nucleic acid-binding protein
MEQLSLYRLSDGVHPADVMIASVCHRIQVPIYTQNVKDMQKVLPSSLVIKPFMA